MNIRAFALAGIIGITASTIAMSQPEVNSEEIGSEVDKQQETLEDNNQAEVNSEEIGSEVYERQKTLELDETEDNCHLTETYDPIDGKGFNWDCSWEF